MMKLMADLFLGEMLTVLRAAWSAHGVEPLLQSSHVTLHETETKVQHLISGSCARKHEAIGDDVALLMQKKIVEERG